MKHKVITIGHKTSSGEVEHQKLNKYLDEGWQVKDVHQIAANTTGTHGYVYATLRLGC